MVISLALSHWRGCCFIFDGDEPPFVVWPSVPFPGKLGRNSERGQFRTKARPGRVHGSSARPPRSCGIRTRFAG